MINPLPMLSTDPNILFVLVVVFSSIALAMHQVTDDSTIRPHISPRVTTRDSGSRWILAKWQK